MSREYDLDNILNEYNSDLTPADAGEEWTPFEEGADFAFSEQDAEETEYFAEDDNPSEDWAEAEPPEEYTEEEGSDGGYLSEEEYLAEEGVPETAEPEYGPDEADGGEEEVPAVEEPPRKTKAKKKKKRKAKKESAGTRFGLGIISLIFMVISLGVLAWSLQNIHPDTGASAESAKALASTDLVARLESGVNNAKASALSDITYIPKHYSIPESYTVAPRPNEANFGMVSPDNAAAVMDVIQQARDSGLLEGQDVIFNPGLNFRQDTYIQYYCDDTILTILWKELIDGYTVTCCEVKVADASQFRRKIVDDTFGSGNQLYATSLAASVNSVVAMNADFYMFRDFGIVVYNRELYRFGEATYTGNYKKYNCTDTLFIDENGDFSFWHKLQEASADQMREYIRQNNILFSIAFGPILVEDGVLTPCDWYPAGEIDRGYSRAGIGQKDHLHYFYMSLNHSMEREARWNVNQFGQRMYERGLQQAYCLDGGQTGEIVWRGAPFNYIDFGAERLVSDIIYFATAIPEAEGTP